MLMKTLILIFLMACNCNGVIYKLSDSDYARMPQIFHLDDYDHCLINPDGIYCTADIDIVSDNPLSELFTMMRVTNFSCVSRYHIIILNCYRRTKIFDSREERLKSFHGLRTIAIFCHSYIPVVIGPDNPRFIEMHENIFQFFIIINGTLLVQTFFVMSGCLLAYKLKVYAEKNEMRWTLIPKLIAGIWIKLTPSYAVVLGLTTTWLKFAGSGPFWEKAVTLEVEECRRSGWANLLYVNNYLDHTQCMVPYLGANMQMYVIGLLVCILSRKRIKKILLTLMLIIGIVTPAAHTYFQDLDAVLIMTLESGTFANNATFNNVYKRGHTNIVNFVLGMALGILIYRWQVKKIDMVKFKKYRFLFLLTLPGIVGSLLVGSVFYTDGFQASIIARAIYAALIKPLFGVIIASLIIGSVFKIDNVYRIILEWDGWKIPSKLSYCVFLLHFMIIRALAGNNTTLAPLNNIYLIEKFLTAMTVSYIAAIPFFVLVDAPLTEFLKMCLEFTIYYIPIQPKQQVQYNGISLDKNNGPETSVEINEENEKINSAT